MFWAAFDTITPGLRSIYVRPAAFDFDFPPEVWDLMES
jgi:hypothetical protein